MTDPCAGVGALPKALGAGVALIGKDIVVVALAVVVCAVADMVVAIHGGNSARIERIDVAAAQRILRG